MNNVLKVNVILLSEILTHLRNIKQCWGRYSSVRRGWKICDKSCRENMNTRNVEIEKQIYIVFYQHCRALTTITLKINFC